MIIKKTNGENRDLYLGGSFALVIGNSDYLFWDKLTGVDSDVLEVEKSLKAQGFQVETERNLTSDRLTGRVDKFIRDYGYNGESRLLIYFAGHGDTQKSSDGRELGYIIPVDTPRYKQDEIGFKRNAISMDTVEGWARKIETKHALFVFDSCFSGKLLTRSNITYPAIIEEYLVVS